MYIEIPLDVTRKMRYTINGMRELEKIFGSSLSQIFKPEAAGMNQIVHLVWVGLSNAPGNGRLSVDDVGDLLQEHFLDKGHDLSEAMDYVTQGLRLGGFLGKGDEEDAGNRRAISRLVIQISSSLWLNSHSLIK